MSEEVFINGRTKIHLLRGPSLVLADCVRTLCGIGGLPGEPVEDAKRCRECLKIEKEARKEKAHES